MKRYFVEIHGYGSIEGHIDWVPVHAAQLMKEDEWNRILHNFRNFEGPLTFKVAHNFLVIKWNSFAHMLKNTKVKEISLDESIDLHFMLWQNNANDGIFLYLEDYKDKSVMIAKDESKSLVV